MPSDEDVLDVVRSAFTRCGKPEHFTNFTHCPECAEHDELLRSRDKDSLRLDDVNNPGWDPLCFVGPAGFAYYFHALARLALAEPNPTNDHDWYVPQLLFHLTYEGEANRLLRGFEPDQRRAVVTLLEHVARSRPQLTEAWMCDDDLSYAIGLWSGMPADASS